ncbi:Adhesin yadA precursor [Citrobacter koseri]|uniref:Adhesin yadA n=1 Tax=Citrobacter koseri TaxID=545 RepID=A0A2X2WVT4_CITKO|nr:Adhesin yadA precursor [Citrobacter koseri]
MSLSSRVIPCVVKSAAPKGMPTHGPTVMQKPCVASLSSRVIPCAAKSAVSKRDAYARIDSNTETVRGELSQTSKYLSGKINANQSAVSKNSRRLDLHESWQKMAADRMNGLQKQISNNRKEIRESAAQNAALAGLFQPYSVGKFNATAALGGYSDKQAVAVGIGYRFTDNVAGKMAVAAGGDSVSWNTGISLEF